jgi:hypothetical protein
MSPKKKNPLKDLNAFLTHQEEASQISTPKTIADHEEYLEQEPTKVAAVNRPERVKITEEVSSQAVIDLLQQLMNDNPTSFREVLGDILVKTMERLPDQRPADKMLINTALYLNNQEDWKSVVENYWNNRV